MLSLMLGGNSGGATDTADKSRPRHHVVLIEDHQIVREGIRAIIAQILPVGDVDILEVASFAEARQIVAARFDQIDLIVCDLSLPDTLPREVCNTLSNQWRGLPVVVISANEDWNIAVELLKSGALGFIPKSSPVEVIASALRLVFSGGRYFPEQVFQALASGVEVPGESASQLFEMSEAPAVAVESVVNLSPRQREVLSLMMGGRSNKEIAKELDISVGTVKNYVAMILRALNTSSRAKAMCMANKYTGLDGALAG